MRAGLQWTCRRAPLHGALVAAALLLSGCHLGEARTSPVPARIPAAADATAATAAPEVSNQVQTRTLEQVTVSAWILPDAEAQRRYGADLASRGLQAVWLRAENASPREMWLLAAYLDPDYFTADEAAFLFRGSMPRNQFDAFRQRFRDLRMRARLQPGFAYEGHVLVPRTEGGRYVQVTLNGTGHVLRFGFALRTPDGHFDYERLDPQTLYAGKSLPDLSVAQLRERLVELPCCASDAGGEPAGDPLNIVMVGPASTMLAALSECGWSFTHRIDPQTVGREIAAAAAGARYANAPVSSLYLFQRPQDLAFQRARHTIVQRNHMRLWLAPYTVEGRSVWVGQVSRDIGVKLTPHSPTLTTHVIDPLVDEARQFVLESLLLHYRVERLGFIRGVGEAPRDHPRANLSGDPYFTDGIRLVAFLADEPVPEEKVTALDWEVTGEGPVAFGQSENASKPQRLEPR
jgi:hypothetical protein